jgi:hypothetical protein
MAAALDVVKKRRRLTELGLECGAGTAELRKEPSGGNGLGHDHDAPTTIQTDAVMLQCSGFLCPQKNGVHVWQIVSLTLSLPFSLLLVGGLFPIGRGIAIMCALSKSIVPFSLAGCTVQLH